MSWVGGCTPWDSGESLSTDEALRFQALFAQQAEKSKTMEEGNSEILRLQEQEAFERDSVLLGSQG